MTEQVALDGKVYEGERVSIVSGSQQWSEFLLADGTVIRLCPVLTKVLFLPARSREEGRPIYSWSIGQLHDVSIPVPKTGGDDAGGV